MFLERTFTGCLHTNENMYIYIKRKRLAMPVITITMYSLCIFWIVRPIYWILTRRSSNVWRLGFGKTCAQFTLYGIWHSIGLLTFSIDDANMSMGSHTVQWMWFIECFHKNSRYDVTFSVERAMWLSVFLRKLSDCLLLYTSEKKSLFVLKLDLDYINEQGIYPLYSTRIPSLRFSHCKSESSHVKL